MALVLFDRVKETSNTSGTGTIVLAGAVTGYQSFAVVGNANTTYYTIADQTGANWEVGIGTYYSGNVSLSRDTILASSNANAVVNFTNVTHDVFITYPAEKSVNQDATGNVAGYSITGGTINGTVIGGSNAVNGTFQVLGATKSFNVNGGTNGVQITPGNTGVTPTINSFGGDANVSLNLNTTGTGTVNIASANVTGGTINGTTIGGSNAAAGTFTTLNSTGGALNGTIGATTPAAITATTITGQTEVLKGTGQNFVLQSQTFESASWLKSSSFITADQAVAPDGTTTADYFYATNPSASFPSVTQAFTCTTNQTYTFSLYVRSAERTTATIQVYGNSTTYINAFDATGLTSAWTRITLTVNSSTYTSLQLRVLFAGASVTWSGSQGIYIWGAQAELASTAGTYLATTTTAVYGTPTLSFSGVAGLGLQSDGSLYVSPAGTGALQAQATTSSTVGGNARGANAVDWQMARLAAARVASSQYSVIGGGNNNSATGYNATTAGGESNQATGSYTFLGGGSGNQASGSLSSIVGGGTNISAGFFNFIGGGQSNSGTASAAVTTQAAATNGVTSGSTAVTLAASNAAIKVGQLISGTGIVSYTYVAAISGTSLTLSQNANATGTPTLSFYTPHGVVVGGGNNQATGSYSFIGGGGDAGTAANRNVASGDWSFVGGGLKATASSTYSAVVGGTNNTASGFGSFVGSGAFNTASATYASVVGGNANQANASGAISLGGYAGTTRSINGNTIFAASVNPISTTVGGTQAGLLILGRQTTDATATVLTSDTSAASGTNQVILPNNSAYYFKVSVIANVTGGGNTKAWTLEGAIKRGSGVGTTAIVGTVTTTVVATDAGAATWAVTATADTTNGGLAITVTGQASTTIRWVARADTTEVTF